ncbi:MAG: hypothetical protein HY843_05425 [Bdellovibrio sp.]|nr:hypothetical protein [Bdellovibrio sp.]
MRNYFIKNVILFSVLIVFLPNCAKVNTVQESLTKIKAPGDFHTRHIMHKGLWLALSAPPDTGKLARIDLQTMDINQNVLPIPSDVQIFNDKGEHLFLLNRNHNDSLTLLKGTNAEVAATFAFIDKSNPQAVSRDQLDRIWVTFYDKNFVQVLSADLKEEIKNIDLSKLRDDTNQALVDSDGFAELSSLTHYGDNKMAILAQRLERTREGFRANSPSGLIYIDIFSFQTKLDLLDILNPLAIYSDNKNLIIYGAGDQSGKASPENQRGSKYKYTEGAVNPTIQQFDTVILDVYKANYSDISALITYQPAKNEYCIRFDNNNIYCETGDYVFNKIIRVDNALFVSYTKNKSSELWVMTLDGKFVVKNTLDLPITAMSFGP